MKSTYHNKTTPRVKVQQREILYSFYDLAVSPATFDVVIFLVLAELERKKVGCTSLHVVIVPGPNEGFRMDKAPYGVENKRWRLRNIVVPCCWLIPSCRQVTVCTSREEAQAFETSLVRHIFPRQYTVRYPKEHYAYKRVDAAAKEAIIPSLHATPQARLYISEWFQAHADGRKVVTITLRECSTERARNSRIEEWGAFARGLDPAVYYPVLIRDIEKVLQPLPPELAGLPVISDVVWNIELRAAIYERSFLNLFSCVGPAMLCFFNRKARCIETFQADVPGSGATSTEYFRSQGIEVGSHQHQWATPFQKLLWAEESANTIMDAFKEMCVKIETFSSATLPELVSFTEGYLQKYDFHKADWASSLALERYGDHPEPWLLRAKALLMGNQPVDAFNAVERSLQLKETPDAVYELVRIGSILGLHERARETAQYLIRRYPDRAERVKHLGVV